MKKVLALLMVLLLSLTLVTGCKEVEQEPPVDSSVEQHELEDQINDQEDQEADQEEEQEEDADQGEEEDTDQGEEEDADQSEEE